MNKKNIKLGIILVVLIVFAYLYQGPYQKWKANSVKPKNFLVGINIDEIDKIEISEKGKTTTLEKQKAGENQPQNKWKLAGSNFNADQSLIDALVNGLKETSKGDLKLASSNKEKKADFQTDESGARLKLSRNGQTAMDFIIGKMSNDFSGAYISKFDSNDTYLAKNNLSSLAATEDWRDKTIFSFAKEKVNKIRFQYPDREFTAEKKDGKWSITIPQKIDINKDKIEKIINDISALRAEKIPEQNFAAAGLEKHSIIVQISGEGIDSAIMVGNKNKEGQYFAKKDDSDNIYLITKEQRDELNKKIEDLK